MIIFIYGQDTYRSKQYLKALKNKFLRDIDNASESLSVLDGATCDLAKIKNVGQAASLFTRRRMVIIEEIFSAKNDTLFEELLKYLKTRKEDAKDNVLVFWDSLGEEEKLSKHKLALMLFLAKQKYNPKPFSKLNYLDVKNWIIRAIGRQGVRVSNQAAMLLSSLVGDNLWQASSEIEKLVHYKLGVYETLAKKKENALVINSEDVEKMVVGKADSNIFALVDAISNKNKGSALKLIEEELEAGSNELQILAMIIRQFKILAQVKEQTEQGINNNRQIAAALKIHPFAAQKSLAQTKGYDLSRLKDIVARLAEIDYKFKSGQADLKTSLEILAARL